ncbi:MAG: helix-turn-helix domain-containing protein [Campylobacterales bacterium]|nr:helix-turn-helix domain-containing protein [Campylobacterales bacterium]
MEVFEKIVELLQKRKMSKKEFALKLISMEPRLKSTGEVPSMSTIYNYLNGNREIKIELLPYIADILNVPEQALFGNEKNKIIKYIFDDINPSELEYIKRIVKGKSESLSVDDLNDIEMTANLLEYAPKKVILKVKEKLESYKASYEDLDDL